MKKLTLWLSIFLLVGCSKPAWHVTSQGYYIYTEASKKSKLVWEGPVEGNFAHGEGNLIQYNEEGCELSRQSLQTKYGVVNNWQYLPCHSYQYLGGLKDDMPQGFGVKVDSDKFYVGEFKEGELYKGYCEIYTRKDEHLLPEFQGILKKGKAIGIAKYYQNGVLVYDGGMKEGLKEGAGIEYNNNEVIFEGYFKKGLYHGTGKYYANGNLIYEGEWYKGKRDGYGTQYDNGLVIYQGDWEGDVYDGKGILYKDGKRIEGKWDEGLLEKSISESTFSQIKNATLMWLNPDSIQNYIEAQSENSNYTHSQIEFIQHLNSEVQIHLSETFSIKIEQRFGFWHLLRMIVQPWSKSDVKRAKFAEEYFCEDIGIQDMQNWINAKIDFHNKNNIGEQLQYINLPKTMPTNTIVDTEVAMLIFNREAMETTDVLVGVIVDILICVVIAFILGFLLGFFFPPLAPYAFIIDIVMTIIAFGLGIYVSVFRTTTIALELESQIQQLMIDNYMQFLESQNIITQMLGML